MATQRTYPAGVTSWVDLLGNDVDAAKNFYGGLFGWTFADVAPPGAPFRYVIAQLDGQDAAGIGGPLEPSAEPGAGWKTYVAVDDAEVAARSVVEAGGRIVESPQRAGEGGIAARCTDPAGAEFGLWQANRRLGAQVANVPGAWNFSDLRTPDPAASIRFYTAVFGWEFDDSGFATLIRLPGYGDHLAATVDPGLYERQAAVDATGGFADAVAWLAPLPGAETPRWNVAFTVSDRDETVNTAVRLGATVVSTEDTDWTKAAVLRDPLGAEFTASQFTPPA